MLCFRKISAAKNVMDEGGGGFKIFRREFSCLRVPKTSVGEQFCAVFQKFSGCEKGYG